MGSLSCDRGGFPALNFWSRRIRFEKGLAMRLLPLITSVVAAMLAELPQAPVALAEGAFATGGAPGRSWTALALNRPTIAEARSGAMEACQSHGEYCTVKFTFRNSCFALAYQTGGPGFSAAARPNLGDAQSAALSMCQSRFGYCEIRRTGCDTIDERQEAARKSAEQARLKNEADSALLAQQQRLEIQNNKLAIVQADIDKSNRRTLLAQRKQLENQKNELARLQANIDAASRRNLPAEPESRRTAPSNASASEDKISGPIRFAWILVVVPIVAVMGIILKKDLPIGVKAGIAFAIPVITGLIGMGMGITRDMTLWEYGILTLPGGVGLFATLVART